jgi:ATP-dependent Lon protease
VTEIELQTGVDDDDQKKIATEKLVNLSASLKAHGILLTFSFNEKIHDREVRMDNGWIVKIGRGFDFYQKPDDWFSIGASDLELRPCLETMVDIFKSQ